MSDTPFQIPELMTDRLILRAPRMSDYAAYADFYASDRAALIGGPLNPGDTWRRFATDMGHWHLMGFGWFTIDDGTGPQGVVGLHHPPFKDDIELGWFLYGSATGKGYATEAAKAARDWARRTLRPTRLVSYIDVDNKPSQRLAARLGATLEDTRAKHDPTCQIWAHPV